MSTPHFTSNVTVTDVGTTEHIIRITLLSVVTIFIFWTNAVIAVVLLFDDKIPYTMKYLMDSLCCADILKGVLLMISLVKSGSRTWIFGNAVCSFVAFGFNLLYAISLDTLAVMIIDKYLMMRFPLKYYTIITRRVALLSIPCVWVFMILAQVLFFFMFHVSSIYVSNIYTCTATFESKFHSQGAAFASIVLVILPLVTSIVVCNVKIYKMAAKHHNRILDVTMKVRGDYSTGRNIKGLKTILIASGISLACLLPSMALNVDAWLGMQSPPPRGIFAVYILTQVNSCSSWFIYWRTLSPFRMTQKDLWSRLKNKIAN